MFSRWPELAMRALCTAPTLPPLPTFSAIVEYDRRLPQSRPEWKIEPDSAIRSL